MPQTLDRHSTGDCNGGRVQQLGDTGPDEGHAEEIPVVEVHNHAGPARVTVCKKLGPHDDIAYFDVDRADAMTGLLRLFGRQSDRGSLGFGEEHLRHRAVVGGGGMRAPRRGVQLLARRTRRNRRTGDPCLVFALMSQQCSMIRVTGR